MSDVVGLGVVLVDEQMFVDTVPGEDQKEKATHYRQQVGGPVPTALAMIRRFGFSCHFIGPWGNDSTGTVIEEDLTAEGISWSQQCRCDDRRTGTAHVWTHNHNGSRTIVAHPCGWDGFELSAADKRRFTGCRLLHLDGTGDSLPIESAQLVRNSGGLIVVDAGSPKCATAGLIPLASVFSFPERFATQFFGSDDVVAAGKQLLQRGAQTAVCTRGEHGVLLFEGDCVTEIPAFAIDAVDSTGAGDVFCGAMIAGLLNGQDHLEAVRTGSAAAALKCRNIGNRDALPTPIAIQDLRAI